MNNKILLVDDEESILEVMRDALEPEGYEVASATNGQEGLKLFYSWQPTLVVMDVMMPLMDGWKLLERIREVSETPVIMLTALNREMDAVRGLKGGAYDYIAKPIRLSEFLARVEGVMRRANDDSSIAEEYKDSILHVDFLRHLVYLKGQKVDLSPQEFRLLSALVKNASTVLSTERLLDVCWGEVGGSENVRVYIGYLRKKLQDDAKNPQLIETVREFGYRYCPPRLDTASKN